MCLCEICNKKADVHHIIHRHEGGLDIKINYIYLCHEHHRGKNGPHRNLEIDIKYKIRLQKKLFHILPKKYYGAKELCSILELSINMTKRITRNLKLYKEGYYKNDIILFLMGRKYYSEEDLEKIRIDKLF